MDLHVDITFLWNYYCYHFYNIFLVLRNSSVEHSIPMSKISRILNLVFYTSRWSCCGGSMTRHTSSIPQASLTRFQHSPLTYTRHAITPHATLALFLWVEGHHLAHSHSTMALQSLPGEWSLQCLLPSISTVPPMHLSHHYPAHCCFTVSLS